MKFSSFNILGVTQAFAELARGHITTIIGANSSGKTSFAVALQACLTMTDNPLGVIATATRKAYVNDKVDYKKDGAPVATLVLDNNDEIVWKPSSGVIESGRETKPPCYPEAVGLIDFTANLAKKARDELFQNTLLPSSSKVTSKLREYLATRIDPDSVDGVLKEIERDGWEAAEKIYRHRARQSKTDWSSVTGQNYGVKVAEQWRPKNWLAEYDNLTIIESERAVSDRRDELSALHQVKAISESRFQEIQNAREAVPDLMHKYDQARKQHEAANADAKELIANSKVTDEHLRETQNKQKQLNLQLTALRDKLVDKAPDCTCPSCGAELDVHGCSGDYKLTVFQAHDNTATEQRIAELKQDLDKADKAVQDALQAAEYALQASKPAIELVESTKRAVIELDVEIQQTKTLAGTEAEVETRERQQAIIEAEHAIETAKAALTAIKAVAQATKLHASVVEYTAIADAIGPGGIRSRMIDQAVGTLNSWLEHMAGVTGWPCVRVHANGIVLAVDALGHERPVQVCSESEKWRIQAMLQFALALYTDSYAVVLDRADVLDLNERAALNALTGKIVDGKKPLAIVICETRLPSPDLDGGVLVMQSGKLALAGDVQ